MKNYHFSCGNSTTGSIGLAGAVRAETRGEAMARIRRVLADLVGPSGEIALRHPAEHVSYLNVYVSPENICESDIDSEG